MKSLSIIRISLFFVAFATFAAQAAGGAAPAPRPGGAFKKLVRNLTDKVNNRFTPAPAGSTTSSVVSVPAKPKAPAKPSAAVAKPASSTDMSDFRKHMQNFDSAALTTKVTNLATDADKAYEPIAQGINEFNTTLLVAKMFAINLFRFFESNPAIFKGMDRLISGIFGLDEKADDTLADYQLPIN